MRRHRQCSPVKAGVDSATRELVLRLSTDGAAARTFTLAARKYLLRTETFAAASHGWYDDSVGVQGQSDYSRRFAGRAENATPSISDPAVCGPALADPWVVG